MADLHPLELLTTLGALLVALLTVVRPEARARLVAAWTLVGVAAAAAAAVGPRLETFGVYAAAVLLALAAWAVSRRVAAAPVREVWREGRGMVTEHVTRPESPWRWVARVLVLLLTVAVAAVALGLVEAPWTMLVGPQG